MIKSFAPRWAALRTARTLVAAAALACAGAAVAQPVRDRETVSLDTAQGHVLIEHGGPAVVTLLRLPTDEERRAYFERRAAELAEQRARHPRRMVSWERAERTYRECIGRRDPNCGRRPERPVEPSDATVTLPELEMAGLVTIGPQNRFFRADGRSTYLQALPPGRYALYMVGFGAANTPVMNDCLCFGSITFDVAPGVITDLGVLNGYAVPGIDDQVRAGTIGLLPRDTLMAVDPRLASYRIVPATFAPVGKLPLLWPAFVNRVAPIENLMRYERDRVIDARTGQDITTAYLDAMRPAPTAADPAPAPPVAASAP